MDFTLDTRLVRAEERFLTNPVGEETMLLDLETGDYVALNETAARIWGILREPCTVGALAEAVGAGYDVDPAQCVSDTVAFLREMDAMHLLAPA